MMTVVERISANPRSLSVAHAPARSRDGVIDAMRGIAILMVIGIHSLPQPLDAIWAKSLDAALRPCVPVFLFVSGYLTALSGRVPLAKRLKAALIPYAIAFAAAYAYMALHNPAMDHRIGTTLARFGLGYVFVYYYVFVYVCCTLGLWLVFAVGGTGKPDAEKRIAASADSLDRLRFACRQLSRPGHIQARGLGRIARRSPHARHSVLVLVCRARRADRDVRRPERPGHAPRAAWRHAGGLHVLCRRAHSRSWRRRHLQFDGVLPLCGPVLRCTVRHPAELAAAWRGSARAATSSISGTSSSSWRCAITPRCTSSAASPALPFAAA